MLSTTRLVRTALKYMFHNPKETLLSPSNYVDLFSLWNMTLSLSLSGALREGSGLESGKIESIPRLCTRRQYFYRCETVFALFLSTIIWSYTLCPRIELQRLIRHNNHFLLSVVDWKKIIIPQKPQLSVNNATCCLFFFCGCYVLIWLKLFNCCEGFSCLLRLILLSLPQQKNNIISCPTRWMSGKKCMEKSITSHEV